MPEKEKKDTKHSINSVFDGDGKRTGKITNRQRERNMRNALIVEARLIFPQKYKEAQRWLLQQGVKVKREVYYRVCDEYDKKAFDILANGSQKYYGIIVDMGDRIAHYEQQLLEEARKDKPNGARVNAYTALLKIQPIKSAYYNQVKQLMDAQGVATEKVILVQRPEIPPSAAGEE